MSFRKYISGKLGLLYIFTALFIPLTQAQPPCTFKHYSTDDGLSHSGVMCMLQDHNGFMWFGTWDGLNRFDGHKFTNYKSRPGDLNGLSNNRIDDIKEDKFGFLWVKTYDGKIHRFNRRTETFVGIPHSIKKYSTLNFTISSLYETREGEMWLITKSMGCFRVITNPVDFSFKVIHYSSNFNEQYVISSNNVNFVFEDSEDDILVGTQSGLNCISGKNKKIIDKVASVFKSINFTSIFEDKKNLWLGTGSGKLIQFNLINHHFSVSSIGSNSHINCIKKIATGLLLGTKNNGIYEYNISRHSATGFSKEKYPGLADNRIYSIYMDKYGLAWIETGSPGVVRYDPVNHNFKHFVQKTDKVSPYVYYGDFFNIFEDRNNYLWIILKGGGFCYYDRKNDQVQYFYNEPGSPKRVFSNLVTCALSDSYGDLWLSTYSRGIEKICFVKEKFRFHTPSTDHSSLTANEVRSIFEDNHHHLWIGTRDGKLYCYDNNQKLYKVYSSQTKANGDISFDGMVYSIIQDKVGNLWFGTKGDGLIKASYLSSSGELRFKVEHFRNNPGDLYSLSNNHIYTICQDQKGRIWVGTFGGGLNLIENTNGKIKFINSTNSFSSYPYLAYNKIRQLMEDAKGRIWVGTTNGLIVFTPNNSAPDGINFYHYQKVPGDINSLANNDVHCFYKDNSNTIWVGTFGGGLSKVLEEPSGDKPPKFKTYNSNLDLPVNIVLSMVGDNKGNLWFATEGELSAFNIKEEKFINFSELDGIKNSIFSEGTGFKSSSGQLYFGCSEGYYSFRPDDIAIDRHTPPVVLENLQLFNKDVPIATKGSPLKQTLSESKSITLHYDQSVFSIEYAGLDFRTPEKLEYAFILEGFEKNWNYVGNQQKATYTNLPPGKYTFKVKCTSNGFYSDKVGKQLEIIILPPWWKTIWAYCIYFILISCLIYIARKITLEIMHLKSKIIIENKITNLKLRFFTNVSHELRTPLTLILSPAQDLVRNKSLGETEKLEARLIERNARRMLRQVNQLLDFRKVQTGKMKLKVSKAEIVSFVKDIYTDFQEMARSKDINFTFNADVPKFNAWIDKEKLDSSIFNLLSNAFKFTPEHKSIAISVRTNIPDWFEISIKDEGVGIRKEEQPLLFQRFAISNQSTDLKMKGTGIGLSLTRELVDLQQGQIFLNSTFGVGSEFIIRLKTGKAHFAEDDFVKNADNSLINNLHESPVVDLTGNLIQEDKTVVNQDSPSVLIVEDDIDLRAYLINVLHNTYNVIDAADGLEGLKKAQSDIPDLIISDIMMPGMDGIELLGKLKDDFKTSHIPVILLTAKSRVDNAIEGMSCGADDYITKPFNTELLLARIDNLLNQRRRLWEKFNQEVKTVDLSPSQVVVDSKDEQFLSDIVKIVEENMSDPEFNVEKIAQAVGLGRTSFFKKLKGLTGMAPVEFLRDMRLKRGYQFLQTGNYSVSEVAYKIGFSDAGYFSKCFKEQFNNTPMDFLKSVKKY